MGNISPKKLADCHQNPQGKQSQVFMIRRVQTLINIQDIKLLISQDLSNSDVFYSCVPSFIFLLYFSFKLFLSTLTLLIFPFEIFFRFTFLALFTPPFCFCLLGSPNFLSLCVFSFLLAFFFIHFSPDLFISSRFSSIFAENIYSFF